MHNLNSENIKKRGYDTPLISATRDFPETDTKMPRKSRLMIQSLKKCLRVALLPNPEISENARHNAWRSLLIFEYCHHPAFLPLYRVSPSPRNYRVSPYLPESRHWHQ